MQESEQADEGVPISSGGASLGKPVDRWLSVVGVAVGIAFYLLPKSSTVVAVCCLLLFGLLIHPLVNFWWVEDRMWRKVIAVCLLGVGCLGIGRVAWPEPQSRQLTAKEIVDEIERRNINLRNEQPTGSKETAQVPQDAPPTVKKISPGVRRSRVTTPSTITSLTAPGTTYFLREAYTNLNLAIAEAKKSDKLLFVVIYDEQHPTMSKLEYSLGYFMEYQTTKRLVDTYFVPAVIKGSKEKAKSLVPEDDPLENCLWVVLNVNGEILKREGVYANPDEGLKRVRAVIAAHGKK